MAPSWFFGLVGTISLSLRKAKGRFWVAPLGQSDKSDSGKTAKVDNH